MAMVPGFVGGNLVVGHRFARDAPAISPRVRARRIGTRVRQDAVAVSAEKAPDASVAAIVLAGGVGKRMQADRPKQFLHLSGKTILQHSLDLFLSLSEIQQVVIVLDEEYREQFSSIIGSSDKVVFADPGVQRQDSVFNGLQKVFSGTRLICIHDSARPLVTPEEIHDVLRDAEEHGAAVLGVPCKATVKESEDGQFVLRTIPRSRLWEVQTPQVIEKALLEEGFALVEREGLAVTDDVSIIEQMGKPVKLTLGECAGSSRRRADQHALEHLRAFNLDLRHA